MAKITKNNVTVLLLLPMTLHSMNILASYQPKQMLLLLRPTNPKQKLTMFFFCFHVPNITSVSSVMFKAGNYYTPAKSIINHYKIRTNETQQYNKQLTSITFSTTDRFSFVCIKPRSTWLWTSSDKQWTVKPNRTIITRRASFRCIKSSATQHGRITLHSAPREDIMSTTLINKVNFSGILLTSVRLSYMNHEPIKGDGTTSFICLTSGVTTEICNVDLKPILILFQTIFSMTTSTCTKCSGFIKGQAPGKLTACEHNFARLFNSGLSMWLLWIKLECKLLFFDFCMCLPKNKTEIHLKKRKSPCLIPSLTLLIYRPMIHCKRKID